MHTTAWRREQLPSTAEWRSRPRIGVGPALVGLPKSDFVQQGRGDSVAAHCSEGGSVNLDSDSGIEVDGLLTLGLDGRGQHRDGGKMPLM